MHWSAIQSDGYKSLQEGQRVEFTIVQGPKGAQADTVVPLSQHETSTKARVSDHPGLRASWASLARPVRRVCRGPSMAVSRRRDSNCDVGPEPHLPRSCALRPGRRHPAPQAAFPAVERQSKVAWGLFTGIAAAIIFLFGAINFLGIVGVVVTMFYLVDVRPKVREITGSR